MAPEFRSDSVFADKVHQNLGILLSAYRSWSIICLGTGLGKLLLESMLSTTDVNEALFIFYISPALRSNNSQPC